MSRSVLPSTGSPGSKVEVFYTTHYLLTEDARDWNWDLQHAKQIFPTLASKSILVTAESIHYTQDITFTVYASYLKAEYVKALGN